MIKVMYNPKWCEDLDILLFLIYKQYVKFFKEVIV